MKKNHILNQSTGKCYCGIDHSNQQLAFNYEGVWYDSNVNPIDHTNFKDALCINCMKQFDMNLIAQFERDAFLIDYNNRLPKTGRAMKFFKSQSRHDRRIKRQSKPVNQSKPKKESKPADQSNEVTESKCKIISQPTEQSIAIAKTEKGKKRELRKKANQLKQKKQLNAKPKDDIILLKPSDRVFLIPDHEWRNQSIESDDKVIEDPADNWYFGDPIEDDVIELEISDNWKIIRHSKELNQWKFVNRKVVKGIPKWIDDSEWIDYKEISELINEGYCQ